MKRGGACVRVYMRACVEGSGGDGACMCMLMGAGAFWGVQLRGHPRHAHTHSHLHARARAQGVDDVFIFGVRAEEINQLRKDRKSLKTDPRCARARLVVCARPRVAAHAMPFQAMPAALHGSATAPWPVHWGAGGGGQMGERTQLRRGQWHSWR